MKKLQDKNHISFKIRRNIFLQDKIKTPKDKNKTPKDNIFPTDKNIIIQPLKKCFFIEGGGTKGIFAIGVLKYLFDTNPFFNINDIDLFGGTSVGSYFATALSFGYQKEDIIGVSKIIDLSKLTDGKFMFFWTICKFLSRGYLYNNDGRTYIINQILNYKINDIKNHLDIHDNNFTCNDLTFGHLRKLIELYPNIYKHLLINTVDLSRSKQIFITTMEDKWDHLKIVDALLASSAIPIVFKSAKFYYDSENDKYYTENNNSYTENEMVDGGTDTNNPMGYLLLNKTLRNYQVWLLKFIKNPNYVKINNIFEMFDQLIDFWISGKNRIIMKILDDEHDINTINLHLTNGTLEIYDQKQIQKIITDTYEKCKDGELKFYDNSDDEKK